MVADSLVPTDWCLFFFFQAEDGIRDDLVTGVQTCALPIFLVDEIRAGRVIVNKDLTVPGCANVFAIGDVASFLQAGKPLPGVAPVAMQQGPHAARNILRACHGEALEEFHYRDRGNLATIGRAAAVADFGWFTLSG